LTNKKEELKHRFIRLRGTVGAINYTETKQEAIECIEDNLQIIACAGSGKTQVISARIVEMLVQGAEPGEIVAFTFTEKAAGQSCRVYTNESHPETCGFSFGSGKAILNNKGDCVYLFDGSGAQIASRCY